MSSHLFAETSQAATEFIDPHGAEPVTIRNRPNAMRYCCRCSRRRRCKNMTVQVYHDGPRYFCLNHCN